MEAFDVDVGESHGRPRHTARHGADKCRPAPMGKSWQASGLSRQGDPPALGIYLGTSLGEFTKVVSISGTYIRIKVAIVYIYIYMLLLLLPLLLKLLSIFPSLFFGEFITRRLPARQ